MSKSSFLLSFKPAGRTVLACSLQTRCPTVDVGIKQIDGSPWGAMSYWALACLEHSRASI